MAICSGRGSLQTTRGRPVAKNVGKVPYAALFRRKRFVKPRLATIGCIAMNDPALGRFIDRRNRSANLIATAL